MVQLYALAAVVGGTLLVCQLLLMLIGIGGHDASIGHDGPGDAPHHGGIAGWWWGFLTFRSVVWGLTFFGLTGLGTQEWGLASSLGVSAGSGLFGILLAGLLVQSLRRLDADGTVRIANAVGQSGTVYLTIPGKSAGVGKVTVDVQGREMEFQAVTFQGDLPTGTKVSVVGVVGTDTVEVVAAPECGRMVHV